MDLRYGLNPEQAAQANLGGEGSPVRVVSGHPSYINVLDALGAWQLVREASQALGVPVATTFKHVSPAGAAVAGDLDDVMVGLWVPAGVEPSPVTTAYVRARDCDRKSSFGDFVAVSEAVDESLATLLRGVVSDGIVAPGYEAGTVELLARRRVAASWYSRQMSASSLHRGRPETCSAFVLNSRPPPPESHPSSCAPAQSRCCRTRSSPTWCWE